MKNNIVRKAGLALCILSFFVFSACKTLPENAYINRGQPESLLSMSAEKISFDISDYSSLESLASWMQDDLPTSANLMCKDEADPICAKIKDFFKTASIPFTLEYSNTNEVTLIYERLAAKDCHNSYVSNHKNIYNLNHPAFGCSIAANQMQMATDQRDFIAPALSDPAPAEKAVQAYKKYLNDNELYMPY